MRPLAIGLGLARTLWQHRRDLHKVIFYIRVNGLAKAWDRVRFHLRGVRGGASYADWVRRYDTPSEDFLERLRRCLQTIARPPLISVVMPVYDTPAAVLEQAIASLRDQIYPHWELCIADDASPSPHVGDLLRAAAAAEPRLRLTFRARNGHIAAASNDALALARGDYVALMDHDDVLPPHALALVALEIAAHPEADLIYSDEDKLDAAGQRCEPYFKPDWDPDLFLAQNYLNHLTVYRRALLAEIGGFREGLDGSQDYDLALRAVERIPAAHIRHIPHVLYHWRIQRNAATFSSRQHGEAAAAACQAVADHLARIGSRATVTPTPAAPMFRRVVHPLPEPAPLVSLLVPTRDGLELLRQCLEGLLHGTDYPALEVIVLDNDSREPATLAYLRDITGDARVRVLPQPGPFNFAAMNNAGVAAARGQLVGFINNDIKVIDGGWLREMAAQACRPDIGAVGAKLLYGNDTIQHGGVILGIGGVGGHAWKRFPADDPGAFSHLRLVRRWSAVTAACLVMRKAVFEEVGGFDAENLKIAFNDVDLCLKLGARGLGILWTPQATLYHLESVSRGGDLDAGKRDRFRRETLFMRETWGALLDDDPHYNPNLTLQDFDSSLSYPPRRPAWPARS